MFSVGLFELLILCASALIILGPEKFPKLAKEFAKFIHQLRSIKEDVRQQASSLKKSAAAFQKHDDENKNEKT